MDFEDVQIHAHRPEKMPEEEEPPEILAAVADPTPSLHQVQISGLYQWRSIPSPFLTGEDAAHAAIPVLREELRLDVDGRFPLNVASGVVHGILTTRVHWIAHVTRTAAWTWSGDIFYKEGGLFPYSQVKIQVVPSPFPSLRKVKTTFLGGAAPRTRTYRYLSPFYRTVDFEFDYAANASTLLSIDTGAHPNRPPGLPVETLSVQNVFERVGFRVTTSPGTPVPLNVSGGNNLWSDQEMHDAMQVYWSHFASKAQWAMWVFFASLHEAGPGLGGIMFDDLGPHHRQGTAIFRDSFIKNPPAGDPVPDAWAKRMAFWTACHEMGHCFNLAHSWQKSLAVSWIPLLNEPEARSFMNYPFNVSGGQSAFFSDFEYRFSDGELLFMRHAPERFVQMGNADWFDHHGFQEALRPEAPRFRLEVRVNRDRPVFEFLEPAVIELKLTNISDQPQIIQENLLSTLEHMVVVVKKKGSPAHQYAPFAQRCWTPANQVLEPGASVYESLFAAVGKNGWEISDPGDYLIQAALELGGEHIVSNPLVVRVTPPYHREEEVLAQDFFTEDVGRVLAFDGSRYFAKANDTLREVAVQLSERKVAVHARLPLATSAAREYKVLDLGAVSRGETAPAALHGAVRAERPDDEEAARHFSAATAQPAKAAETLGHIDYKYYVDGFTDWLEKQGRFGDARDLQRSLLQTLESRRVLDSVLHQVESRIREVDEIRALADEERTESRPATRRTERHKAERRPGPQPAV